MQICEYASINQISSTLHNTSTSSSNVIKIISKISERPTPESKKRRPQGPLQSSSNSPSTPCHLADAIGFPSTGDGTTGRLDDWISIACTQTLGKRISDI